MTARPRDECGRFVSPKDIGQYCVTVWDIQDGDIIEKIWNASQRDLDELEQRYQDEPGIEIQIEDR